ncbi:MAG: UvrD-helicase domain-containing protein [Kiritimatiellia bacterium]|jgi:DNA helicase-2/ATP-dependent DNA helicase PcrA|nr:UvrD-helicase domain-containing protein [Kiritimatiellia bacterium]
MSKFLAGLNSEQKRAVSTVKGPLLVLAGAGTGKTRVITHRIAHMIANGIPARSILAMTFTNRAATEMKERVAKLTKKKKAVEDLTIGTFHSFCVKALRQFSESAGVRKNFGICDADDQLVAMKQALRQLRIPETVIQPRVCLSRVSLLKNRLVTAHEYSESANEMKSTIGRAYEYYDRGLQASGLLDFDDLLLYMVKLLEDKKMLSLFRKRYQYLLIDEYQDTNGPQYEIVQRIAKKHRNVCAVGDDDQSIYGWRGADVSKILNFEKDFGESVIVRLETNYRSTTQIIKGANLVIRNNSSRHDKKLKSAAGNGSEIKIVRLDDEEEEALHVVDDIEDKSWEPGSSLRDFAILFRTQVQPRLFEQQLRRRQIPYRLVGGMSFFDRKEVRDILSYLRLIANPSDELSLLRVINTPPRGIGDSTINKALAVAAEQQLGLADVFKRGADFPSLSATAVKSARAFIESLEGMSHRTSGPELVSLVKGLVSEVKYKDEIVRCYKDERACSTRWDAINEIVNMAEIHARQRNDASLISFLEDLAINATDDSDDDDSGDDKVTLMTLHSAKGLEFKDVHLVGVEEGLLPHARSIEDGDIEEERRLAYVGITRAQKGLTLSYTRSRARYGQRAATIPSRFLYELKGKQVPDEVIAASAKMVEPPPPAKKKKKVTRRRKSARKR